MSLQFTGEIISFTKISGKNHFYIHKIITKDLNVNYILLPSSCWLLRWKDKVLMINILLLCNQLLRCVESARPWSCQYTIAPCVLCHWNPRLTSVIDQPRSRLRSQCHSSAVVSWQLTRVISRYHDTIHVQYQWQLCKVFMNILILTFKIQLLQQKNSLIAVTEALYDIF